MSQSIRFTGLVALALCGCASVDRPSSPGGGDGPARPFDTPPIPETWPPKSTDQVDRSDTQPTSEPSWTGHVHDPLRTLEAWDAATHDARLARVGALAGRLRGWTSRGLRPFEDGAQRHEMAVFSHDATGIEFVLVPGGVAKYRVPGPDKRRCVEVSAPVGLPFLIARTEMTTGAFAAARHESANAVQAPMPVSRISFTNAAAWCANTGLSLPTAAQWEFACRAGSPTDCCGGDRPMHAPRGTWSGDGEDGLLQPVAQQSVNAFGLFDMCGNLREWCCGDAPDARGRRVAHGRGADAGASSFRRVRLPDDESWQTGFRPAFTIPMEALAD